MKKIFDKKIYFPYPNYASRKHIIQHMIEQKAGRPLPYFPSETFAHISEGFTAGSVIIILFSLKRVFKKY
jgi:hypothetical protein